MLLPVSGRKKWKFSKFHVYDKLWGDDITNSLIWIFIRTGQEMFSEKMWNFKMSQLPYFLSDFHKFCTNLWGNFYSFFWNYVNSGLDFPFKVFARWVPRLLTPGQEHTNFFFPLYRAFISNSFANTNNKYTITNMYIILLWQKS